MKGNESVETIYIFRGQSKEHKFLTPSALRDGAFDDPRIIVNKDCIKRYDFTYGKTFFPYNCVDEYAFECCFLSLSNFFLHIQHEIKQSGEKEIFYNYCRSKYAKELLDIDSEKEILDKCYEYSKHIFNGPVFSNDYDNNTQFNNLFLTMSEYQHLNVFSKNNFKIYLPSMMLDFSESKDIAIGFAKEYETKKIIYRVNFSRICELLKFRPDLFNALNGKKNIKTSDLNLSFLGVVLYLESNNEKTREEKAVNIFWPWKIEKSEIGLPNTENTLGYVLNIEVVNE